MSKNITRTLRPIVSAETILVRYFMRQFSSRNIQMSNCCVSQVRDGGDEGSPLLGSRHCGNSSPLPLTSSQNMMWIRYVTDGSNASTGFQASYDRVETSMSFSIAESERLDIVYQFNAVDELLR